MSPRRILYPAGALLFLYLAFTAGRNLVAPPPDVSPVGFSCPTERRIYCDREITLCHSERDNVWSRTPCTIPPDIDLPDIAPRPVYRCEDESGPWYSWAPCNEEPDPIEVF